MKALIGAVVAAAVVVAVAVVAVVAGDGWSRRGGPAGYLKPMSDRGFELVDQQGVTAVAYSPDGRVLATAGLHGLRLWDAVTGNRIRELAGPEPATDGAVGVTAVAFAPNGRAIAGGDRTGRIRLWNVADGALVGELTVFRSVDGWDQTRVTSLVYAPDGRTLAATGWRAPVALWDTAGDQIRMLADARSTNGDSPTLALAADGRRIVLISPDLRPLVWDMPTGEPIRSPDFRVNLGTGQLGTSAVAFDPHSRSVVRGGWRSLQVLYPDTGDTRELIGHEGQVVSVAFAPDGLRLVSVGGGSDKSVRLWHAGTRRQLRLLCGRCQRDGYVTQTVFRPDGHAVAVANPSMNQVRVWRV